MTSDKVWPYPELDALALSGIVVGPDGRRHLDEGVGGVALTNAIARLPDPLSMTVVFDATIWEGPGRSARIPANPALANAGGTIWQAPTLPALARLAGLDAANLESTVSAYNGALADKRFATLAPPRTADRFAPKSIATAPFFAIPLCAGMTYTMGGIKIDGSCRVLRQDGSAIPGLYAAGSATGGLEGGSRIAYLGGLAKAGVQGLAAAEHVAARGR
jgi:fumarate reductase flavoprotein subunit